MFIYHTLYIYCINAITFLQLFPGIWGNIDDVSQKLLNVSQPLSEHDRALDWSIVHFPRLHLYPPGIRPHQRSEHSLRASNMTRTVCPMVPALHQRQSVPGLLEL